MKKILVFAFVVQFSTTSLFSQKFDGYKYVIIPDLVYRDGSTDIYGVSHELKIILGNKGFIVLPKKREEWPQDSQLDPCLILVFKNIFTEPPSQVGFTIVNCKNEILLEEKSKSTSYSRSLKNCLQSLTKSNYSFNPAQTPIRDYPEVETSNETEETIKNYLSSNVLDPIEGIYQTYKSKYAFFYKVGIIKKDGKYKAIILESLEKQWQKGLIKAVFEPSAENGLFSVVWYMADRTPFKTFGKVETANLLSVDFNSGSNPDKEFLIKMYPESNNNYNLNKEKFVSPKYGSGFFVTASGIIATNAHVVDNTSNIEITVSNESGVFNYKTKILLIDKRNDVALLQVDDEKFKPLSNIPYSITENSAIGSKVFTIGFPLNEVMGTNYKVNDGIISSISGIKDDVRYYQISVPLQPGNSGGPLFDKDGNIIGLTSARLNSEAVGTQVENVNYAIKSSYLLNLYYMLPNQPKLLPTTLLANKELVEQVKVLKNFVCLIKAL